MAQEPNESYYQYAKLNENQSSIFQKVHSKTKTQKIYQQQRVQQKKSMTATTIYKNDPNLIVFRKFSEACV